MAATGRGFNAHASRWPSKARGHYATTGARVPLENYTLGRSTKAVIKVFNGSTWTSITLS